ncbi:pilin [Phaeacidiphilus oryzae]|uniref:pilin n=1 Tax=Phaeacidiphilus oryzae TaxID=348818 RepID=UPI0005641870|nr:pilin [Phaeacidiphilus oryzae]
MPVPRHPPAASVVLACPVVAGVVGLLNCPSAYAVSLLAVNSVDQTIANITHWIVGLLAALATLFLTIGGLRYLMAGGDPGEVEKAKTALKSAAIGYMLAILAPVLVGILKGLVGA